MQFFALCSPTMQMLSAQSRRIVATRQFVLLCRRLSGPGLHPACYFANLRSEWSARRESAGHASRSSPSLSRCDNGCSWQNPTAGRSF